MRYLNSFLFIILTVCSIQLAQGQQSKTKDLKSATQHELNHGHEGHDHSGHGHEGHDHSSHGHSKQAKQQDHSGHDHSGHDHGSHAGHDHGSHAGHGHDSHGDGHGGPCGHHNGPYDPTGTAIHHISDGNVYSILDAVRIPLPTFLYAPGKGWDFFMSNKFDIGHHEDGHKSYNGYVMHEGSAYRVTTPGFPMEGSVAHDCFIKKTIKDEKGKDKDIKYVMYNGKEFKLDARSTFDGGLLGGGITSFYDYSISKNVLSMILVALLLFFLFRKAAKAYTRNPNSAPSGLQNILETVFMFIRDEVAIPFIGEKKYMKFLPFLMSIFFFILGLNLWGQVPFLGSTNVTGNLTFTMVLAIIVFIVVNINGNADYWKHIFWMPGVPVFVKPVLAAVEGLGLFIKPLTLMLRLAGNISAGHIAILSFIGLIFIFGDIFGGIGGNVAGTFMSIPLTMFMMALEIIVAFVQAFVFTILTASYIGAATEEHEHH